MNEGSETPKISRFKRGLLATKSSWTILKMSKRLILFPLVGWLLAVPVIAIGITLSILIQPGHMIDTNSPHHGFNWLSWLIWAITGMVMYMIFTFVSAAVVAGALMRFRGQKPTIRSVLKVVGHRFGSLFTYGFVYGGVGQVLSLLEERLPLAGKILAYFTNIAWSIATMFAVPVIVDSDERISPQQAIKQSANIVRKVWGESIAGGLSLGAVFIVLLMIEILLIPGIILAATFAATTGGHSGWHVVAPALTIDPLLLFLTLSVMSALNAILSAALYYYATTGDAPEHFSRELLHQAFSAKKARRMFAKA